MERVNEKKMQQLKYAGVPWVTIHTPIYARTPSTSGRNTPSLRSTTELPPMEPATKSLFNHSSTLFSNAEANVIRIASIDESADGVPLHRSPSRLQQIQLAQQELHPEFILGKSASNFASTNSLINYNKDEDLESVISLNDDLEPIGVEETTTTRTSVEPISQYIGSGPVTKEEIQDHIWDYCKETGTPAGEKRIVARNANFILDQNQVSARLNTSFGMRKKLRTVNLYSGVEKERQELRGKKSLLSKQNRQRLEASISAMKYAKYMHKQDKELPDFLDGVDFTDAKMKYGKKKAAKTQPGSPRNSGLRTFRH